jgi:hypothetical protein
MSEERTTYNAEGTPNDTKCCKGFLEEEMGQDCTDNHGERAHRSLRLLGKWEDLGIRHRARAHTTTMASTNLREIKYEL